MDALTTRVLLARSRSSDRSAGAPSSALPKGTIMRLGAAQRLKTSVLERRFVIHEIPGILWTSAYQSAPAPLILLGHPGGLGAMYSRLMKRAGACAAAGFASGAIELPRSGDRPGSSTADRLAATCVG